MGDGKIRMDLASEHIVASNFDVMQIRQGLPLVYRRSPRLAFVCNYCGVFMQTAGCVSGRRTSNQLIQGEMRRPLSATRSHHFHLAEVLQELKSSKFNVSFCETDLIL